MKIKVCGLKYPGNIKAVAALAPDMMGFICYAPSPRYIDELQTEVLNTIDKNILKTGVFVNESMEAVAAAIEKYNFDAIQLHGNESPAFCAQFKGKVKVLKAFGMDDSFDFTILEAYTPAVDVFMFDTKTDKHGGSGQVFNWQVLDNYKLDIPFFICGGLSLANLKDVKAIKHPQFYGVDLNSRFETSPGFKDISLLQEAFNILR